MEDMTPPHWRDDDIDDVVERLTVYGDVPVTIILEVISALSAALTQSRAETSAAYEQAADVAYFRNWSITGDMIRALATPDQSSALAAIESAAEARGMRRAAEIARALGMAELETSVTPIGPRTQAFYAAHDAILAAIPQGDTK